MPRMAKAGAIRSRLEARLRKAVEGEVLFAGFDRGRYATDASIYQMFPLGVVVPKRFADVEAVLAIAREEGVPVLPRGGGTSQAGQTVNEAIVIDFSKYLNRVISVDADAGTAIVEPGLVLDELNRHLKPTGQWFPVDVSTSSRATLGGMAANNSCGSRSIRYGMMRDNVRMIDALMADGSRARFEAVDRQATLASNADGFAALARDLLRLGAREADEIRARFPDMPRRVGGYNLDALVPNGASNNLSALLVGSEGTLAISEKITLKLSPVLREKLLGICHFPTFREAMEAAQHLVKLGPTAVELMDRTMIDLSRQIPIFRPVVDQFVRGEPAALLMVEFAEPDREENRRRLSALHEVMADLGFRWGDPGKREGGVVEADRSGLHRADFRGPQTGPQHHDVDEVGRQADLLHRGLLRPIAGSCRFHRQADRDLSQARHGRHLVRPCLGRHAACAAGAQSEARRRRQGNARHCRGSLRGRAATIAARIPASMATVSCAPSFMKKCSARGSSRPSRRSRRAWTRRGLLNPGKIVDAPKMDDRRLFRYPPDYAVPPLDMAFDWSGYTGQGRGFQGAVEMCNNNGACRKLADGVMCPSYRVTRNERDSVRGRANSLRLAISGQLGADALASDEMMETLKTCVSCKGCRRECPTSVDMAKMKIEVLRQRVKTRGLRLRDRLVAYLPRYAPYASRVPLLMNLRDRLPGLAALSERLVGLAAGRTLPHWASRPFRDSKRGAADVLLFADTFNRYFEPDNLDAADTVLERAGLSVAHAMPADGGRPLCCGRTFLAAGLVDEAREEMRRSVTVLKTAIDEGAAVVGLEPSCVMTFRDEAPALLGAEWTVKDGERVQMFEEFLARSQHCGQGEAAPRAGRRKSAAARPLPSEGVRCAQPGSAASRPHSGAVR